MSLAQQVFTNAGVTMLGNANAGSLLTITKIVVGTGSASSNTDLYPLTALIAFKNNLTITRKTDLGGGKLIVSGSLVEALLAPGASWQLRELGIMAKIGSGTEQLYTVANTFADSPDTIVPGGTSTHAFDITVIIDRATNVTVTLGDPNTVDIQNIPSTPATGPGVYAGRAGNVFQMKRLVAGTGVSLVDGTDRITINRKTLADITLYVPASHPEAPGPDVAFATLQLALDYLNDYIIPLNVTVFIKIAAGTYTSAVPIQCLHPQSQRIFILGAAQISKAVTAIVHVDTTHKKVTVSNTSGLVVGQRAAVIGNVGGYDGGCKITAISGLDVTCTIEKRDARPAYTTAAPAGGLLIVIPTVLIQSNALNEGVYCPYGIGMLQEIILDGGSNCLHSYANVTTNYLACWNAANSGVYMEQGLGNFQGHTIFTQCLIGLRGDDVYAIYPHFNACTTGLQARHARVGSQVQGEVVRAYFSHCIFGINVQVNSDLFAGLIRASTNNSFCNVAMNSVAAFNLGLQVSVLDNNGSDLVASGMSYITYWRNGGAAPLCNPAAGVVGNDNSLINLEA